MSGEPLLFDVSGDELATADGEVSPEKVAEALNRLVKASKDAAARPDSPQRKRKQAFPGVLVRVKATVADTFPLPPMRLGAGLVPSVVRVTRVRNLTDPSDVPTNAVACQWQPTGGSAVVVTYIPGLTAATEYLIDFEVEN